VTNNIVGMGTNDMNLTQEIKGTSNIVSGLDDLLNKTAI
jgi:hypothetical protein